MDTPQNIKIKPILKWVGGKSQIIDRVLSSFPKQIHNYYEPFLGGGSVLFALLSSDITVDGEIYASDFNADLINVYQQVQKNPIQVSTALQQLVEQYTALPIKGEIHRTPADLVQAQTSRESFYYWIRQKYNQEKALDIASSALFVFLNKTCFRGMYRVGPSGFNVPYGHYKNPSIFNHQDIQQLSACIQKVHFQHAPFQKALMGSSQADFVYLDPPYAPLDANSFVGYTAKGFPLALHHQLFNLCKELPCKFVMSNACVPLVTDAFSDVEYSLAQFSCRRAINAKKPGSKAEEVLVKN